MGARAAGFRATTTVGGLVVLALATAGCPGPSKPTQVEPALGSDEIDMEPAPADPEPERPPPEAGVVELGPAMMTGGAGMSQAARTDAKKAFMASFEEGRHHFRRCYAQGLARDPALRGAVDVEVVLSADGSIYDLKLATVELADEAMVRCVVRAFRKLTYAPLRDGELFSVTPVVKFRPE